MDEFATKTDFRRLVLKTTKIIVAKRKSVFDANDEQKKSRRIASEALKSSLRHKTPPALDRRPWATGGAKKEEKNQDNQ